MLYGHRQLCVWYRDRDIAKDIETNFDTSGLKRMITGKKVIGMMGKNKKVIGMMKDELGGKIVTEFFALKAKMYCLIVFT